MAPSLLSDPVCLVPGIAGLLQDREEAGFKGAAAPLRGPGGVPQSLFSSAPAGRKETLQHPWAQRKEMTCPSKITLCGRLMGARCRLFLLVEFRNVLNQSR